MEIQSGHYVTDSSGEIYVVEKADHIDLFLKEIATKRIVILRKNKLKPLWLQAGDEVILLHEKTVNFKLDEVLYDALMKDYFYVFYNNQVANKLLYSDEIIKNVDKFEP